MKPERILQKQDDQSYNVMSRELRDYKPLLEDVKSNYEELQLGDFSNAIFKEIVTSGTGGIELRFKEEILSQMKKAGITLKIMQENMAKGNKQLFEKFKDSVNRLEDYKPNNFSTYNIPHLPLENISYSDGEFFISEKDKEQILEKHFRVYLETEEEHHIYDQLTKFIDAYEVIKREMEKIKFPFHKDNEYQLDDLRKSFLAFENGKYVLRPERIKDAITYHERQERQKKQYREQAEARAEKLRRAQTYR